MVSNTTMRILLCPCDKFLSRVVCMRTKREKNQFGIYQDNLQYSQRGTFINPLPPVVRIIHARSNTATEHPLTLVVMTLAFREDRTRGFAVVAREGTSRSTVFHRLYSVHVNCLK